MDKKTNILKVLFKNDIDCYVNNKLYYLYIFIGILVFIIGTLHLINGNFTLCAVSYITVTVIILFMVLLKLNRPHISICGLTLAFMTILTYYFVAGPNNGVAGIWVVIVPIAFSILINTFYSIIISTYFLILVLACCFTPARQYIFQYSPEFFSRFPFIYVTSYVIGIFAGYYNQLTVDRHKKQIELLDNAVLEERERNNESLFQTISVISNMVDAKDRYTCQHSINVATYAKKLAIAYGLSSEQSNRVYIAGLVHDIGKVNIPDDILKKPGKLTDEEYAKIKEHPEYGFNIFINYKGIDDIKDGIIYHHERVDGKGYPSNLAGDDIPLIARIISIADAYDAMSSDRCYRTKLDEKEVRKRLISGAGTQFDIELIKVFIKILNKEKGLPS